MEFVQNSYLVIFMESVCACVMIFLECIFLYILWGEVQWKSTRSDFWWRRLQELSRRIHLTVGNDLPKGHLIEDLQLIRLKFAHDQGPPISQEPGSPQGALRNQNREHIVTSRLQEQPASVLVYTVRYRPFKVVFFHFREVGHF